jgi:hypothetical protein
MRLAFKRSAVAFAGLPHWLTVGVTTLGSAFVGGAVSYLEAVPTSSWIADLQTPKAIIPIVVGAAVTGGTALLAQAVVLLKAWGASQTPTSHSN